MKKIYKLNNLDCANCAAQMEEAVKSIEGVIDVAISFMTQKMSLEINENYEAVLKKVKKACKKVEPDCEIIE